MTEVGRPPIGEACSSADIGFLITDNGRFVHTSSPEFRAMIGAQDPNYDTPMCAVENLGFIAVTIHDTTMEVVLNLKNVAARALDALVPMLVSSNASFFRFRYLAEDWQEEIAMSGRDAAKRIVALYSITRIIQSK